MNAARPNPSVTRMPNVIIPGALIAVSVTLDLLETEKLVMVCLMFVYTSIISKHSAQCQVTPELIPVIMQL